MTPQTQDRLLLGISLALLALPLLAASAYFFHKYQYFSQQLEDMRPRHARLLGLIERQTELQQTAQKAQQLFAQYAYPASLDPSQAGNDAQQKLRTLFSQAKLDVISSQVLAAKQEKEFDKIPLNFRLEGDVISLQSALAVLPSQTPTPILESLNLSMQTQLRPDKSPRLTVQVNFSILRARS